MPDGKTEVDLEVDQFVPYLLDIGDTAVHKSSSSSRCYPIVLSQNRDSFDKTTLDKLICDEKRGIVGPSQCPMDRNCGTFTMTDLERTDDPHRAIGSDVLAAACVEHIPAANSALPDAAIPIVVWSEDVVFRENCASVSHNVVAGLSIDNECFTKGKLSIRGVPCFQ